MWTTLWMARANPSRLFCFCLSYFLFNLYVYKSHNGRANGALCLAKSDVPKLNNRLP